MNKKFKVGKLYYDTAEPARIFCLTKIDETSFRAMNSIKYTYYFLDTPDDLIVAYEFTANRYWREVG